MAPCGVVVAIKILVSNTSRQTLPVPVDKIHIDKGHAACHTEWIVIVLRHR